MISRRLKNSCTKLYARELGLKMFHGLASNTGLTHGQCRILWCTSPCRYCGRRFWPYKPRNQRWQHFNTSRQANSRDTARTPDQNHTENGTRQTLCLFLSSRTTLLQVNQHPLLYSAFFLTHQPAPGAKWEKSIWINTKCLAPRSNSSQRKGYLYSKGDWEGFNGDIAEIDFNNIDYGDKSVDHYWDSFKALYAQRIDEYAPHKYVKPEARHKLPWVRHKLVKRAKLKARKWFIYACTSRLNDDKILHWNYMTVGSESLTKTKACVQNKLVDRILYSPGNFGIILAISPGFHKLSWRNGETITDEVPNEYFTLILVDEPPLDATFSKLKSETQFALSDICFSEAMLAKKLQKFKPDRANEPDGISANNLRNFPNLSFPTNSWMHIHSHMTAETLSSTTQDEQQIK